jgi:hypothetical protein
MVLTASISANVATVNSLIQPNTASGVSYVITASINGMEDTSLTTANAMQTPIDERMGSGLPVLQRIEKPRNFQHIENPTLYYSELTP